MNYSLIGKGLSLRDKDMPLTTILRDVAEGTIKPPDT
jgi:hypothetical protein